MATVIYLTQVSNSLIQHISPSIKKSFFQKNFENVVLSLIINIGDNSQKNSKGRNETSG